MLSEKSCYVVCIVSRCNPSLVIAAVRIATTEVALTTPPPLHVPPPHDTTHSVVNALITRPNDIRRLRPDSYTSTSAKRDEMTASNMCSIKLCDSLKYYNHFHCRSCLHIQQVLAVIYFTNLYKHHTCFLNFVHFQTVLAQR